MPFKSKEQERYLQINEPEIYQDWVEKYGHFKGAESLSLNPMEVPNTISRYYMVFVDNKNIGSYLTVEEAQEVAESKNGEVIEYIADLTDAEREYMTKVNREFSQRQKTGEFFKDWWWKEESDRFSNADDPYLRYTTTFPEENDFFDENILGEDDRRSKWISDAYGISPQMARILDSSRVFGMYMSQRDSPATIKKYRERILDAIDDYTPQSEKEAQMLKVLRPHMATRGVKGPSPSFWTTYRGWSYPKPELSYNFDDYYDYPVPFMGYDLDKDYVVEDYGAEECVSCDTPDGYWRGLPLCSSSGEELCISCCACNMCRSKWNMLEVGEQKAESFSAEDDMIICEGCNMERYSDVDFTIDNAREDVLDDGDVLCDYCWASHDKYVENAESFNPHVVQKSRKATRFTPSSKLRTGAFRTKEEAQEYRKLLKNKGHGKFGQSLRVVKANKYDPFMETFGKNAKGEYFRDWQAESFGAEGDYEPSFDSLEERIEWMEFAVNDKFLHQYEDDYSNVVLDIEEWNENNGNNSKLSNLVKQYKNKTGWMDAESFGAEECSHIFGESAYQDATCSRCGKENEVYVADDSDTTICSCGNRMNGYTGIGIDSNRPMRGKSVCERCGVYGAESFRSYKVAPDLSSYTKAELVSSIAGPQGTAAYDEVVYDPVAQSRLSAESIDSFSPARLIVLGASIGVALGLYNTRRD